MRALEATPSVTGAPSARPASELAATLLTPLARYAADELPAGTLEAICARAGLEPAALLESHGAWVSHEQFEAVLAGVRERLPDDDAFMRACAYRLEEGYGPLRFLLWATSPGLVFEVATRTMHVVSAVSRYEVLASTRTTLRCRYTTSRPESRLMCLARQAAGAALPTLWGLPHAEYRESSCVARGDPCCEYEIRWADRPRWLAAFIGGALGAVACAGLAFAHVPPLGAAVTLPLFGLMSGYAYELRRSGRVNLAMREDQNEALRQLAAEESEARRELLALGARQREWSDLLEEAAAERAASAQRMMAQIAHLQEAREVTLRGFSHDLRNPLSVLRTSIELLREGSEGVGVERDEFIRDLDAATAQMSRMLDELMKTATSSREIVELAPATMDVATIVDRLRRRLRALVHGRDIRVTVFRTREAPDALETDSLLFDRVVDNLLTNAAKYTERGSIIVEVDGSPGTMTLKVSDTGRGIRPEVLERTFEPGGSDAKTRADQSYGVGLSVVVQLLAQVGGRLEVMSKPGRGTTFWVHLPLRAQPRPSFAAPSEASAQERHRTLMNKVVTIRRAGGT
jgi:signal transduction histidine kinase